MTQFELLEKTKGKIELAQHKIKVLTNDIKSLESVLNEKNSCFALARQQPNYLNNIHLSQNTTSRIADILRDVAIQTIVSLENEIQYTEHFIFNTKKQFGASPRKSQ